MINALLIRGHDTPMWGKNMKFYFHLTAQVVIFPKAGRQKTIAILKKHLLVDNIRWTIYWELRIVMQRESKDNRWTICGESELLRRENKKTNM